MAGNGRVSAELSRELTLFHITMMGLGMMIGAGVFIGIGISIREVGPGGPSCAFALEVASILADEEEGEVVAFTVASDVRPFDIELFVDDNRGRLRLPPERVTIKVSQKRNVVDAILEESEQYDLVVLGCTREPFLYHVARATVPEIIAQRCAKPLVTVKSSGGIRSWIKRWV